MKESAISIKVDRVLLDRLCECVNQHVGNKVLDGVQISKTEAISWAMRQAIAKVESESRDSPLLVAQDVK